MSEKKKQHYVPQCYLQNFCNNGTSLNVFDKDTGKTFGSNTINIAREIYFYDFPDFDEESYKKFNPTYTKDMIDEVKKFYNFAREEHGIEDGFSKVEEIFSKELDDVIKRFSKDNVYAIYKTKTLFELSEKKKLANLIALQVSRTKSFRENIKTILLENFKANTKITSEQYDSKIFKKSIEDNSGIVQACFMCRPEYLNSIIKPLVNRYWVIGINNTSSSLYTSDTPISWKTFKDTGNTFDSYSGFLKSDLIAYPLNDKIVLLMYYEPRDEKCIKLNKGQVKQLNILQVKCSVRQIYSKNNSFSVAKKVLKQTGDKYKSKNKVTQVALSF